MYPINSTSSISCALLFISGGFAHANLNQVDINYNSSEQKWVSSIEGVIKTKVTNLSYAVQEAHKLISATRTPASKGLVIVNGTASTPNSYGTGVTTLTDVPNMIYDFSNFRVRPAASGACISATRCHNMEVRNFKAISTGGWGFLLHFVSSNNILVNNIELTGASGPFGIRMDGSSRTARMENPRIDGTVLFQGVGAGRHGIETMFVKDFSAPTAIVGRQLGGCALLFNETDGGYIESMNVDDYGLNSPYAAFRIANSSTGNMRVSYFIANNGNRGLTTLSSCTQNLTVDRYEITGTHLYYQDGSIFPGSGQGMRLIQGTITNLGRADRRSFVRGSEGTGIAIYSGAGIVNVLNTEISGSPSGLGVYVEAKSKPTTFTNCASYNNGNDSRNYSSTTVTTNSSIDWR